MATSGTYTDISANLAIIGAALQKIGRLGDHETFADTDVRYTKSLLALKLILKSFSAIHGMPLWAIAQSEHAMSLWTDEDGVTFGLASCDVTQVAPLRILQAIRRDDTDTAAPIDVEMLLEEQDTWNRRSSKATEGTPNIYTYYPEGPAASANAARGTLKIWPLPDSNWTTNGKIILRYIRPLQDVGTSTQHLDFPQEWQRAVVYALAYDIAPDYGLDLQSRMAIKADRDELIAQITGNSTEEGSLRIQPRQR